VLVLAPVCYSNYKFQQNEVKRKMTNIIDKLSFDLQNLKKEGFYKEEKIILSKQSNIVQTKDQKNTINFCANNYLGLANNREINQEAKEAIDKYGFGMASVRFICGTHKIHKDLEKTISSFLHKEDTILYSSCFDANTGLFETILSENDAVISDMLNHASIIDGIRLCKAKRFKYENNNMDSLEKQLQLANDCDKKLIVTDGVFSMDGIIANLDEICNLADKYNALVMVDDSHGIGVLGENGRGSIEVCKVIDRIDILTGTLGKALGGASGGYVSGKKEIIEWLRQRSRPYLFSNTLAPVIAATSIKAFELVEKNTGLRNILRSNSKYFRTQMLVKGFNLSGANHPIIPVIIKDELLAKKMADELNSKGVLVVSFSFPVVPKNTARIRVQISSTHTQEDLDIAIEHFEGIGKKLKII
jgi:glycine C-acetyltransferase|tara:strand:- start:1451 stop:2701 length:1251 start_codon:yes stop_codon:yes gene_type:complete